MYGRRKHDGEKKRISTRQSIAVRFESKKASLGVWTCCRPCSPSGPSDPSWTLAIGLNGTGRFLLAWRLAPAFWWLSGGRDGSAMGAASLARRMAMVGGGFDRGGRRSWASLQRFRARGGLFRHGVGDGSRGGSTGPGDIGTHAGRPSLDVAVAMARVTAASWTRWRGYYRRQGLQGRPPLGSARCSSQTRQYLLEALHRLRAALLGRGPGARGPSTGSAVLSSRLRRLQPVRARLSV